MEILQVAMTIDETRQDSLAFDVDHLSARRKRHFAATTDGLELTRLDNDDGILDRRPASAIDQFSTLYDEDSICHDFLPPLSISSPDLIADTVGGIKQSVQNI
jgi:hypothetical protein